MRSAAADLTTSLRNLLDLDDDEQTVVVFEMESGAAGRTSAGEIPAAPSAGDAFDGKARMTALDTAFANLEAAPPSSSEPHSFTPPRGHGQAFEKFLATYTELASTGSSPDIEEQTTPLIDNSA